jgi:ATP/ADP translocase
MTQKAKDNLISLGFAMSAIICITSDMPLITYITFIAFVVFAVLWITKTNVGQKVYNNFLDAIGKDDDIDDFEYVD